VVALVICVILWRTIFSVNTELHLYVNFGLVWSVMITSYNYRDDKLEAEFKTVNGLVRFTAMEM
jgi:hypothetical protein